MIGQNSRAVCTNMVVMEMRSERQSAKCLVLVGYAKQATEHSLA